MSNADRLREAAHSLTHDAARIDYDACQVAIYTADLLRAVAEAHSVDCDCGSMDMSGPDADPICDAAAALADAILGETK